MTYNKLRELILEGAPDMYRKKRARKAMEHYSYTSYSFRITNGFREKRVTDADAELMVVDYSDAFYRNDLLRYEDTGTFDRRKTAAELEEEKEECAESRKEHMEAVMDAAIAWNGGEDE